MKTVIGSAAGVILLGMTLMGFAFFASSRDATRAFEAANDHRASTRHSPPGRAEAEGAQVEEAGPAEGGLPLLVDCGPGQQALVRQVQIGREIVPQVECVGVGGVAPEAAMGCGRQVPAAFAPAGQPAARQAPVRSQQSKRGWKEPLLVIGGSSAAGAGVGGIFGGKKGALIGAAIGGGASAIYEATRK
ncbi:MAG: hypothetical protein ACE148_12865 [Vicinamibacterales bacterium]